MNRPFHRFSNSHHTGYGTLTVPATGISICGNGTQSRNIFLCNLGQWLRKCPALRPGEERAKSRHHILIEDGSAATTRCNNSAWPTRKSGRGHRKGKIHHHKIHVAMNKMQCPSSCAFLKEKSAQFPSKLCGVTLSQHKADNEITVELRPG